jgi:uncharacterized membrane protein YsdA (DUF1294 family)
MTAHLWHVAISWALALGGFGALAVAATVRHRTAAARLKQLDPRGGRNA